jgi:hypothetical protein
MTKTGWFGPIQIMKPVFRRARALFALTLILLGGGRDSSAGTYDADPKHLWNRLESALFLRSARDGKEYGLEELDIVYWRRTKHLLEGASHTNALAALDEFISKNGEKEVRDPWKRALLQRRLWQLFDWSASTVTQGEATAPRRELQKRLAMVIRRVALTTNEIAALPDPYALAEKSGKFAELPRGLNETNGPWINVHLDSGALTASAHAHSFEGASGFQVFFRHPNGRAAGVDYLKNVAAVRPQWISVTNDGSKDVDLKLNSAFPTMPLKSQWALVRRMFLIDVDGMIRPTQVVESIQARTYLTNAVFFDPDWSKPGPQKFQEFRLANGAEPKLIEILPGERHFERILFPKGIDPFERDNEKTAIDSARFKSQTLLTCRECHNGSGLSSVLTFTRLLSGGPSPYTTQLGSDPRWESEETLTIYWKRRQYSWGLLEGLWSSMKENR